ncbi:hypothetical protein ACFV98_17980 [Streptomyces violascens]|uniref:hypothetical protein n=1 Tax=Streptomyces violascens TaxID=67381 RepID=UPI00364DC757
MGSGSNSSFAVHHGDYYLDLMFGNVLNICASFLAAYPSETILMRVSQTKSEVPTDVFKETSERHYLGGWRSLFHINSGFPTLGEVRGKVVLMSGWPHIGGLSLSSTSLFDTEDLWDKPAISVKKTCVSNHLTGAANAGASKSKMFMTYSNANHVPTNTPWNYSKQVNPHALDTLRRIKAEGKTVGVLAMDYIDRPHGSTSGGSTELTRTVIGLNPLTAARTGTLEYAVRTGSTWSAPVPLPWQSASAPALASYQNKLYALFVRPSDKAVMWTRPEGQNWKTPERIGGDASNVAPAVAAAHDKLFCVITGTDDNMYWRTFTESTGWSGITQFPQYRSKLPAALAFRDNQLWMTSVGTPGDRLYTTFHNGTQWSNPGWTT